MRQPQIEDRFLARERPETKSLLLMRWEQLFSCIGRGTPPKSRKHFRKDCLSIRSAARLVGHRAFFHEEGSSSRAAMRSLVVGFPGIERPHLRLQQLRPSRMWFYSLLCNQPSPWSSPAGAFTRTTFTGVCMRRWTKAECVPTVRDFIEGPEAQFRFGTAGPRQKLSRDAGVFSSRTLLFSTLPITATGSIPVEFITVLTGWVLRWSKSGVSIPRRRRISQPRAGR